MEDMSYVMIFLLDNMSYGRILLKGGHFLLEDMSYGRIYLTIGHVLWEDMSYE